MQNLSHGSRIIQFLCERSCKFKLGGQRACWHTSLAMFGGLATKLAHLLAPKHAMSPVAAPEPRAAFDMHAKVADRPIYHKATLGMMGFASSCSRL